MLTGSSGVPLPLRQGSCRGFRWRRNRCKCNERTYLADRSCRARWICDGALSPAKDTHLAEMTCQRDTGRTLHWVGRPRLKHTATFSTRGRVGFCHWLIPPESQPIRPTLTARFQLRCEARSMYRNVLCDFYLQSLYVLKLSVATAQLCRLSELYFPTRSGVAMLIVDCQAFTKDSQFCTSTSDDGDNAKFTPPEPVSNPWHGGRRVLHRAGSGTHPVHQCPERTHQQAVGLRAAAHRQDMSRAPLIRSSRTADTPSWWTCRRPRT